MFLNANRLNTRTRLFNYLSKLHNFVQTGFFKIIFQNILDHEFNTNHIYQLIKKIARIYCKTKLHYNRSSYYYLKDTVLILPF